MFSEKPSMPMRVVSALCAAIFVPSLVTGKENNTACQGTAVSMTKAADGQGFAATSTVSSMRSSLLTAYLARPLISFARPAKPRSKA